MSYRVDLNLLRDYFLRNTSKGVISFLPTKATNIQIRKLSKISGGIHGTYSFRLHFRYNNKCVTLKQILKLYREKELANREYSILKFLEDINFPVPHADLLETNEKFLGFPFVIMEKVEGKTMNKYLKNLSKGEIFKFFERFAKTLATLHNLDIRKLNLGSIPLEFPKNEYDFAKKQTLKEEGRWVTDFVKEKHFEWAIRWLENNFRKCPCYRYSLLHGDMNPNNFLITKTGRIVFLDWTWAEIGDPLKDLCYVYHHTMQMFSTKDRIRIFRHFIKQYIKKYGRKINSFAFRFYLFSTGLREAIFLNYQSKKLMSPASTLNLFGTKLLPIFPFVYLYYKNRYKRVQCFLQDMVADSDYEQAMFKTFGGKILSTMEVRDVLKLLKPSFSELFLDIGTGSGRIARAISKNSKANVIGIDRGLLNIEAARERIKAQKICGYELIVADGQYLPFKENVFDGIICIRTLKYFPNYKQGISEMYRVLKSGKRLILDLSSSLGYEVIFKHLVHLTGSQDFHVFNFYKMRNLLKSLNFVITDAVPLQKIPYTIWDLFENRVILNLLIIGESILRKITPLPLSRSVLIRCIKDKMHSNPVISG